MKRRTENKLFGGLVVLMVAVWVATIVVFVVLIKAMLHAAERGDTAMTIFYGVILLILVLGNGRSKR